ncbi:Phospholipid-glycerol acyltransferase [Babesia duncani]|uniref:Phospholipid-glycerol acyltransferase n=1 Tax=Babesia duncani TaxID=323732 RepID=A0AAD9PIQ2_9APIC|nr:Phospholipid-glycerol acyltransferase [Babesia duncani]
MFNHQSFSDAFLINAIGRHVGLTCVYKDSINKLPLARQTLPLCGNSAIKFTYDYERDIKVPDKKSILQVMEQCKDYLLHGLNLCVFPEGKRSRTGPMEPFKDGFFRLACDNGFEILPCAISNGRALWSVSNFVRVSSGTAWVNVGEPIQSVGKSVNQLKEETRLAIYKLLKECPSFDEKIDTLPEYEKTTRK